jgi:putative membrane protein
MDRLFFALDGIYCGSGAVPLDIWSRWNLDPPVLLALAGAAYAVRSAPRGLLAISVLAIAFVSPLCAASAALFSARVLHHLLLIAVAAPLLVSALRPGASGRPALSFACFVITLWVWHVPPAYDLALSNKGVYWIMQLTLLGSALWFWRNVLTHSSWALLSIAAFAQMGLLGALITLAPAPLYAAHQVAPLAWGLAPLSDQQIGGLIMWVPGGIPFAAVAILAARRFWSETERVEP